MGLACYYFFPEKKLPAGVTIDKIVVFKSHHLMDVWSNGKLLKTYSISIGKNATGAKQLQGDNRTPEGSYFINDKNPNSTCYKNLGISYPDIKHAEAAKQLGKSAGGDIKIHGLLNGCGFIGKFHRWRDWTNGCIAVTDAEMDELYYHLAIGTAIDIYP